MDLIDEFSHDKYFANHLRLDDGWELHDEFDEDHMLDFERYQNRGELDIDPWNEDSWTEESI